MNTRYFKLDIRFNGFFTTDVINLDVPAALKPSLALFTEYYKGYPHKAEIVVLSFIEITEDEYLDLI